MDMSFPDLWTSTRQLLMPAWDVGLAVAHGNIHQLERLRNLRSGKGLSGGEDGGRNRRSGARLVWAS
jgi:hypothetical protein